MIFLHSPECRQEVVYGGGCGKQGSIVNGTREILWTSLLTHSDAIIQNVCKKPARTHRVSLTQTHRK